VIDLFGEAVFQPRLVFVLIYKNSGQGCGNVGIAERFPRAVGRVENLILVFHAFHRPVISTAWSRLIRFCSLLLLLRGSTEAIRFRAGLQDVSAVGDAIEQCFAESRVRNDLGPLGEWPLSKISRAVMLLPRASLGSDTLNMLVMNSVTRAR
jgi:hypothetical protein